MNKQPEALRLADRIDLKDYYEFDASLHCQKAAAELRRLHIVEKAFQQWITKTEWVQKSSQSHELGMHRADVMKQRIDQLLTENQQLLAALIQPQPKREPLTNEQIKAGLIQSIEYTDARERCAFNIGVRFAERAHGIK